MNHTDKEIEKIEQSISRLQEKLLEKRPSHFRERDIVNAFFASLLLGLVFIFKGSLIEISMRLSSQNLAAITIATIIILTLEIYFVGYTRVSRKEKKTRHFGQFWIKRLLTFYVISMIVSLLIVYIYGINLWVGGNYEIVKLVVAVSMPCAIGAAIPSMLRQY
jgi:uncharacterized membrane protein